MIKDEAEFARMGYEDEGVECTCLDDLVSRASPVEVMLMEMNLELKESN